LCQTGFIDRCVQTTSTQSISSSLSSFINFRSIYNKADSQSDPQGGTTGQESIATNMLDKRQCYRPKLAGNDQKVSKLGFVVGAVHIIEIP